MGIRHIWASYRSGNWKEAYELSQQRFPGISRDVWAAFDYLFLAKKLQSWWGGPLNGQHHRQRMVQDVLLNVPLAQIVETGTFRGTTTAFIASSTLVPIETVEIQRQYFLFSKWMLRPYRHVSISQENSVPFLRSLIARRRPISETWFVYLDAHWYNYLPLLDELKLIFDNVPNAVVMIDDFQVPGDAGYGFDDYGETGRLTLDYLAPLAGHDFTIFYPSIPSSEESGMKRGSVVLAIGPRVVEAIGSVGSLRRYGHSSSALSAA
jgi:hypothetical protein